MSKTDLVLWMPLSSMASAAYVGIDLCISMQHVQMAYIYILYAFLVVWLTDTGAYIFGRLMGKT